MTQVTFICLANSRKLGGRCLAGKKVGGIGGGSWIRPISGRRDEELSDSERQYAGRIEPRLLDVIQAEVTSRRPTLHQQENWLIDPSIPFVRVDHLSTAEIMPLVDPVSALWELGESSYNGVNDRFPEGLAGKYSDSLKLLDLVNLTIEVELPYNGNKHVVRGHFQHGDNEYSFRITDPSIEDIYIPKPTGEYEFGKCLVTVSLGEKPFEGYFYKFLAAVIPVGVVN